jgi:hypothetical protein
MPAKKKFWLGSISQQDDYGDVITEEFIDGKTRAGPWAIMTPRNWRRHGIGDLGIGRGQRYVKQDDGMWLKVEG